MIKKEISDLFDTFARQELGNRLSEFALLMFKSMVLQKIDKLEKGDVILSKSNNSGVQGNKQSGTGSCD